MDLNLFYSDYKVYLNNVEVPADNITITNSMGSAPSTASFMIHPTESAFDIPIRTLVHITITTDLYQLDSGGLTSEDENGYLGKMPEIVIFEGEILSKNFVKSQSQNVIQISAVDFRQIFDTPILYLMDLAEMTLTGATSVSIANPGADIKIDSGILSPYTWLKARMKAAKGDLVTFVARLITGLNNDFYKGYNADRRINSRIVGNVGEVVINFLNQKAVQELLFNELSSTSGNAGMHTINSILATLFSAVTGSALVDTYTNNAPPPPKNGKCKNFIMTPRLIGIIPPVCNVFFPDLVGSISVMDSIKYTRGVIEYDPLGGGSGIKITQDQDWAPPELVAAMAASKETELKKRLQHVMTAEETRIGIFPVTMQTIGFPGKESRSEICNYGFALRRYSQNYAQLGNCPLNPFAVLGLPAVVYIPGSSFSGIGILSSITHSLNNNSQTSNFTISNFTPRKELAIIQSLSSGFLKDFSPEKMDNIYYDLIGCEASTPENVTSKTTLVDLFTFLDGRYTNIKNSSNSFKHSMNYANREIATKKETLDFLGNNFFVRKVNSDATILVEKYVYECSEFMGNK
jgi:hypothetical protein